MKKDDDEVESMLNYIEALESANETLMAKLDDVDKEDYSDDIGEILKNADPAIVELFKAAESRAAVAEEIAKAERENRLQREFVEKAAEYDSLPVETSTFGIVLKEGVARDFEHREQVSKLLRFFSSFSSKLAADAPKPTEDGDDADSADKATPEKRTTEAEGLVALAY